MITITRKDLYEKVWSSPTTKLREVFGISDVAIAKLCKKLKIPKPSRGYWEKIRCGHPVPRPPLHPAEGDIPEETTISPSRTQAITNASPAGVTSFISPEDFKLPPDLKSAHPLVRETLKQLIVAGKPRYHTDTYHRLRHVAAGTLDIRVSVEGLPRTLKIMEALIRGLESKELSVLVHENPQPWRPIDRFSTQVSGFEHPVCFHIEELSKRVKYVPPNGQLRWSYYQRFDYRPTGKLRLVIDEYCDGCRRQWDVSDDESLGETLTAFTYVLAATAKVLKLREIKHEREKREIEIRQRREYEEEEHRRELNAAASKWAEAQQLRSFLSALKNEISRKKQYSGPRSRLRLWLAWAEGYINSLDPIPRLIKELEKDADQYD
ncbi:MAG: hypothetical protein AB7V08_10750 [Elusimicrobiales bacterium]